MHLKTGLSGLPLHILIALFGMVVLFLATPNGLGISPDSISYLRGGQSLLEHGSLNGLPTHWPPGYPALLALFALPQGDYLAAARYGNVIIFGLNLFLFNALLQKSGWSRSFASVFAMLLIFDPDFLNVHLMVWSEPTFLSLMLAGLLALLAYDESRSTKYLFAASFAFGMSVMVRYVGISLIFCVAIILLYQSVLRKSDDRFLVRLLPLLQFLLITLLPISLWIAYKHSEVQHGGIRSMVYHPITAETWHQASITIGKWFGGPETGFALFAIVVILIALGNRNMPAMAKRLLVYAGALFTTYFFFIWLSLLFFDASELLDQRLFSPAKLLAYLMVVVSLKSIVPRWQLLAASTFAGLALLLNYSASRTSMRISSQIGVGFARADLKNQPILSFIRINHIVVDATNSPELTFLYLNQEVPTLPKLYNPETRLPAVDYAIAMVKLAQSRNTVAMFNFSQSRDYLPNIQQLIDAGFTNIVYKQADGIILQHP